MAGYLDFIEYGGGVIFAEQIPYEEYENVKMIDVPDAKRFAKYHVPSAVNIKCRPY